MDDNNKREYRQVLKITSIFGGTQIIVVLSSLVRSKIAALLIGPIGVGISSIYNNILLMLVSVIGLGIGSSAIREIAQTQNKQEKIRVAKIAQNLTLYLSIAGLIITILCSYLLSQIMFGDGNYTLGFCIIAIAVFFSVFSTGYDACLKGFQAIKKVASILIYSAIFNIAISFILFYLWGVSAIPIAITFNAMCIFFLNHYKTRQIIKTSDIKISVAATLKEGKIMVVLGIMLMLSGFVDYIVSNATNVVISRNGSLNDIGLFQGAMMITTTSINMILSAMSNDYYPRLAKNINDKKKLHETLNIQVVIAILLMVPILNCMIVASPILIYLFLSEEFLDITNFIHWILFGFMFMSVVWCLYFVPLAHGDTKRFMFMSITNAVIRLSIQIPGYLLYGLMGLAIGHAISTILYALFSYIYINKIYNIKFELIFIKIFLTLLLMSSIILIIEIYGQNSLIFILLKITGIFIIGMYSYSQLNRYMNISKFVRQKLRI